MKTSHLLSALVSLVLMSATPAALAGYTCGGPVRGVAIDTSGDILAESIGPVIWPRLCNIRTAVNGIPPESCKIIYSTLLAAQASGRSVTFWINDPATTCATLAQWQWVNGFYFLRIDG